MIEYVLKSSWKPSLYAKAAGREACHFFQDVHTPRSTAVAPSWAQIYYIYLQGSS